MDLYYTRVSTTGQNDERQFDGMKIDPNNLYQDKISGAKKERPQLTELLKAFRPGDTIHVWSIDRAARNLQHLLELIETINSKEAAIHFHKEGMVFNGGDNPMQKMQLQIMGSVAEFQRSLINEAAAEGRAVAKAKGVKFGRSAALNKADLKKVVAQRAEGKSVAAIATDFDVSRPVIYKALKSATTE